MISTVKKNLRVFQQMLFICSWKDIHIFLKFRNPEFTLIFSSWIKSALYIVYAAKRKLEFFDGHDTLQIDVPGK